MLASSKLLLPSLALIMITAFAGLSPTSASAQREPTTTKNIIETLEESERFTTLLAAIDAAGLTPTVAEIEAATLFAPSDRAFRSLPEGALEALLEEPAALRNLLTYHIIPGTLRSSDLDDGALATLLQGSSLNINVTRYWRHYISIDVDDARVRRRDLTAANGIIHEIDSVLDPGFEPSPTLSELIEAPQFSIFASLLSQARLDHLLEVNYRDFTLLAPTDAAFAKIPEADLAALTSDRRALRKALLNHIVLRSTSSEDLLTSDSLRTAARLTLPVLSTDSVPEVFSIGSATITEIDVPASNGLLHTIDTVLLPENPPSLTSLIDATPNLSTLSTALNLSSFGESLNSNRRGRSFTIFAPSDAAFADLTEETLNTLLADPTGALAEILGLHIVRGKITAARLRDGQKLKTLSGDRLTVAISDDGITTINGTSISQKDLRASNGIVHIIDAVLQDEPFSLTDLIASKRYLTTLNAAIDAAGLTSMLDDPTAEFTLLAPIDSAFRKLPEGTLEALLQDPKGALAQALRHHIIPGSRDITSLTNTGTATTLSGREITFSSRIFRWHWYSFRRITVDGITLVVTDLPADNGTLHVITSILTGEADAPES